MKLFALLCLIGFAAATSIGPLRWQVGTTYVFKYSGRLITGIPELSQQYSGVGIKCEVDVTVHDGQKFGIKIRDGKFVRVNNVLEGNGTQAEDNWRKLQLPAFSDIPEESRRALQEPIVFKYAPTGQFEELVIDQTEPEWSVNFKKALVALLQTKFAEGQQVQSELENNKIETGSSEYEVEYNNWNTREESVDGICDVAYQVNELPKYMIKEQPEKIANQNLCPDNSKYYEITKSRDVSSCIKRTSFSSYKPGFYRCAAGNCQGMWSRSSITRYIACGNSRSDLRIQSIYNEGELQQNLLGFKTEKFLTGTKQELKLIDEHHNGNQNGADYPRNPVTKNQLYYEYDISNNNVDKEGALLKQESLEGNSLHKSLPHSLLGHGGSMGKQGQNDLSPRDLIPKIKQLFQQLINQDLVSIEKVAEKQITMKVLNAARAFSVLDKESLKQVYSELKSEFSSKDKKQMFKNVFYDTIVMGGSVNNILFVKDQILAGELNNIQMVSFFTFLPHYVIAPTHNLLNELFELVSSSNIKQSGLVYNHAIMGYTSLLQKACLAENRETSYPTFVFGEFCNADSEILLVKWIPYLQREIEQTSSVEKRNLLIVALGLLSHKNVIPVLVPIVERSSQQQEQGEQEQQGQQSNRLSRFLAIYSLTNVGRKYPNLVTPLVFSVFSNQAESTEVRIAAFNVILRSNPTTTMFHKIAASTWVERDNQVLDVVNTAIFSLSNQKEVEPMYTFGVGLQRKAWLVYPLIKKTGGRYPTSGSVYSNDYLRILGIGYSSVDSWIGSKDSVIPSDYYHRITYFLDRYQFTPCEVAIRSRGAENFLREIVNVLSPNNESGLPEEISGIGEQLHQQWREVLEKLRVKSRDNPESETAIFLNLFEDSPIFHSFHSESREMLREKINQVVKGGAGSLQELAENMKFLSFQKIYDITPSVFSIPSDMGLPIVIEVHMPVAASLQGKIEVDWNNRMTPRINLDVKTLFASQMTGWVGTLCPFTNEFTVTGIDEHAVVAIPAKFEANIDLPNSKVDLVMTAMPVSSEMDFLHYHHRPYTVHEKLWNLEPMTLSSNAKIMKSRSRVQTLTHSFGDYLGLKLTSRIKTETPFADMRTALEKLRIFNYNPMNFLRFGWASGALNEENRPSLRQHEVVLRYDPNSSTTKEIRVNFQISSAYKRPGQPIKVPKIEVRENGALKVVLTESREGQNQKVCEMLENSSVESGTGVHVRLSTTLKGRVQRTYTYNLNAVAGLSSMQQKWNLHLESENSNQKLCINGQISWPSSLPVWKMSDLESNNFRFHYENVIGFGHDCQESQIKVQGSTQVSEQQKRIAAESAEAKLYKKLKSQNAPLAEISDAAEQLRTKLSTLDHVDFDIKYQNVPVKVAIASEYVIEFLKAVWWPNLVPQLPNRQGRTERGGVRNMDQQFKFRINSSQKTFDLVIRQESDEINFRHVRIPYPLNFLFPLPATREGMIGISTGLVGKPVFPKCQLEGDYIRTFDNRSAQMTIDNCFHLLAGECASTKNYGVLIRQSSVSETSNKDVKIFLGKTSILMTPSERHSRYDAKVRVVVNGTEMDLKRNQKKTINGSDGQYVADIVESEDGVVTLRSRQVNLVYNGFRVQVEGSYLQKNRLCGLCGDLNDQQAADLRGPKQCVYSDNQVFAASYRVSTKGDECQPMPNHIQQKLEKETEECVKYRIVPTKLMGSFESQNGGRCTIEHHEIIDKRDQLCFSRKPVIECGASCKAESMIEKKVSFGCLPKNTRMAERYTEKVQRGEVVPELENLSEDFKVTRSLPKSCVPVRQL